MRTKISVDWAELMRLFHEREKFPLGIFAECVITNIRIEREMLEATHFHTFKEYIPGGWGSLHLEVTDLASGSEIKMDIPLSSIEGAPQQGKLEHQPARLGD